MSECELLTFIEEAFSNRQAPESVVHKGHHDTDEFTDALAFEGKSWKDLTCAALTQYSSAVSGFSPEAYCYFLPGIYSAGIREHRPNLLVNESIIGTLDRSNMPSSWDNFFLKRWPQLSVKECEATQRWLLWLASLDRPSFADASLARAFDTITVLINQRGATPLAAWSGKRR